MTPKEHKMANDGTLIGLMVEYRGRPSDGGTEGRRGTVRAVTPYGSRTAEYCVVLTIERPSGALDVVLAHRCKVVRGGDS